MEKKDGTGSEIIYHFDVEQHRIPLQQFIDTAHTTKDILEDFNREFFGNKLKYSLYVAPSEKGGLTAAIIISVAVSAIGIVFKFLESDIGKSAIKSWTGEKPDYWSEELNNKLKKILLKSDRIKKLGVDSDKTDTLSKEEEESVLSVLPSYLLSENVGSLKAAGITPDKFPKAFKARTTFYDACIGNKKVRGIAFDRSDDFWIKRDRFKGLRVELPEEAVELQEFQFETIDIVVHSPDWEFNENRKWQCRDEEGQSIKFIIEDAVFSSHARDKDKDIKPDIIDTMQVQWIYQGKKSKRKNVSVLKVILYNSNKMSKRLSEEEIKKICAVKNIFLKDQEDAESLDSLPNLLTDLPDDN